MTKTESALAQAVIDAFHWHDTVKHGKSMARLREAVSALESHITLKHDKPNNIN